MARETSAGGLRRIRGPLLRWYRANRRDLPWRRTRDPYAIWVSEIMLQQTQVATVVPYYVRFLERFPDVVTLAEAPEEAVLSAWSGLGYYRRARSLHAAARAVAARHAGRVPEDPDALRALPGVGRYTAGAVASVAFNREEPVLDGNVKRVLCRLCALSGRSDGPLWALAASLVRGPDPGDLNQALMELGATVCTPRAPRCDACPVRSSCRARASGRPEDYPEARPGRTSERVRVAVAIVRRGGRVLLERPDGASPLRGTWDLPATEAGDDADAASTLAAELLRRHGLGVRVRAAVRTATHGILHRRLRLEAYPCTLVSGRPSASAALRWVRPAGLDDVPVSGATRKLLARR